MAMSNHKTLVYLIIQRYKFKSKLQRSNENGYHAGGVFDNSKIQIQKQITTRSPKW